LKIRWEDLSNENNQKVDFILKTFFIAAMVVIIALSCAFVGYGIYLNEVSSSHIDIMMASRAVSMRGIRVSSRDIRPEIVLDSVNLQTGRAADVIARIDGAINGFAIVQGQEIKRGQALCTLVNIDIALQIAKADTDTAKAQASYVQAKSEVDRNHRLAEKDSIAKSELEASVARMKSAEAELSAAKIARSQLEQERGSQTVTSPIDGFVVLIYSQTGSYVQKGTPVALVADFSKLVFKEQVADEKIRNISPVDAVFSIRLNMSYLSEKALAMEFKAGFGENFVIHARIRDIAPPMTEDVPLRIVTWELDNNLGLLEPGRYNELTIGRDDLKKTLAVPIELIDGRGLPALFVEDSDSRLGVKNIGTGVYGGGLIEVLDGIEEGDVVVTSEVEGLEPGVKIDVILEDY
jgi:RND family efflux transporter MFP subunit